MLTTQAIIAVANAVSAACQVLMSPAGQRLMDLWVSDAQRFRADIDAARAWLTAQFRRIPEIR